MRGRGIRSIRQKLILIILAVTVMAIGVGFGVVIVRDVVSYRAEARQVGVLQARLVGQSCLPALTFDDPDGAKRILSSLDALPDFRQAVLFDERGAPFSRHSADVREIPLLELHQEATTEVRGPYLHIQQPIVHRNRRVGSMYLVFSLEGLGHKIKLRVVSLLALLLILVVASYALAHQFQRIISVPILNLAAATERIAAGTDFSMRLQKQADDEIGILYDRFNQMLEQLDARRKERDRVEDELRQSEMKYRAVFDGVMEAIFIHDKDTGGILDVNEKMLEMYGYTFEEAVALQFEDLSLGRSPFSAAEAAAFLRRAAEGSPQRFEWLARRKSGELFWAEVSLQLARIGDREQVLATVRDVTDRKKVEDELTGTRNYLRNVFDSLTSMLISIDGEGGVTQWNSAAAATIGAPWSQVTGRPVWQVLPLLAAYREQLMRAVATQRSVRLHREQLEEEKKVVDIDIFPFIQNEAPGAAIRIDDVTELALKDEQLRRAQKLETVGTLAGGLAHDFNNYLAGIVGRISLLQYRFDAGGADRAAVENDLKVMEEAAHRAADMVQQLLGLSRRREIILEPVDLNPTVERVLKICRHTIDKSVEIKSVPSTEPAIVKADAAQIEQVLLNLCINAAHAMTLMRSGDQPLGGVLSIAIQFVHADAAFCARHAGMAEGGYWCIRVSDTGVGIAPLVLPKVFDPFFSGKEAGQGSGLGLSIVYSIVQQHHGLIDVYSEVGVGSTFHVYLPALVGEHRLSPKGSRRPVLLRGSGLILVVDDEDVVRQTARTILEECGYEVLTASDGEEGLESFRRRHDVIDAILLDMAMPKMSGRECYAEMKRIQPDVKVILTSGFRQDERVADLLAQGILGFLQKPYSMVELAKAIHDVLAPAGPTAAGKRGGAPTGS